MSHAMLDGPTLRAACPPAPTSSTDPSTQLRPGHGGDVAALLALHARCSADTIQRRYHTPMPYLSLRRAQALLAPPVGWSIVATFGSDLIGVVTLARDDDGEYEVGLLVEDRWQHQGLGGRLLYAAARQAARQGIERLTCFLQPGNLAMLATIRRAGFNARITTTDGLLRASIRIRTERGRAGGPQRGADRHEVRQRDHAASAHARGASRDRTIREPHRLRHNCSAMRHGVRTNS